MTAKLSDKHARRILTLAAFLRKIPKSKFDIGLFAKKDECGTVCCAAGWAGTIPQFRRAGLTTDFSIGMFGIGGVVLKRKGEHPVRDLDAATKFFGLEDTYQVFLGEGYPDQHGDPTPRDVANRLISIVKERNLEAYKKWRADARASAKAGA